MSLCCLMAAGMEHSDSVVNVSLLTASPGADIYELEGHTALRFRMADSTDITVHWGLFDFNAPAFVYRFVKGETDYLCGATETERFLDSYDIDARNVTEQNLAMTPAQKASLLAYVEKNLQPGNRVYRYNYVLDNCATRPLRLIEEAFGDTLAFKPQQGETTTFRDMMRNYHRNYPWYQFGIDLALGSGIDRPISIREECFAPVRLMELMAEATVGGRKAVSSTATPVFNPAPPENPTPWYLAPVATAWTVLGIGAATIIAARIRHRMPRILETTYYAAAGIAGLILTFLIFVSEHEATSPNWLYLWLNPLCFIGASFIWLKNCKAAVIWWQFINFAAIIALCVIAAAGVQSLNQAFFPLMALDLLLSINRLTSRKLS